MQDAHKFDYCADLLNKVKALSQAEAGANEIQVGIIGYPNMGKSCVKSILQEYMAQEAVGPLYENVSLLPKQGVIFSPDSTNSLIIKHVSQPEELGNPYVHVHALLKKVPKAEMLAFYEIPDFGNTQDFLNKVAKSQGQLLKKGIPDYDLTAKLILKDWMAGKIHYFEECPDSEDEVSFLQTLY